MKPHPYAEVLRAIADGQSIQFMPEGSNQWVDRSATNVLRMVQLETEDPIQFRIKPQMVNVNGRTVPAPLQNTPENGTMVWQATICANGEHWAGAEHQLRLLQAGKLFMSSSDCHEHAAALLG